MKFSIVAALALVASVQAADSTTVTCPDCPAVSSTPDIVTREPLPTTSCTEKPLTVITGGAEAPSMSSGAAMPTGSMPGETPSAVPVSGASGIKSGSMGAIIAVAAVAAYML
ncbi:hypothetical protein FALBO_6811 [Fusarium albosuccineum]|uniref:Uncharacterized protein n=1 Tax=Fusarium albosuccineum TaxID=1237068 RepID=A0A8H4LEQ5_9HYPO|nr:hypothetical protein FALBO_6811 [Fusarium albosuccineum]